MKETTQDNKRIAKNTVMLYIRMFVMLAVGLYTSRVVLDVLGVSDYGIYNIIGGVVVLFSFINNALISATQRFLNFNLGKGDVDGVHRIFCMSMNAFFLLSILFLILAETIGLWFVRTQLNIPLERYNAALFVYQFTILTFIVNIVRIPYNASIIAYEKMDFYAYISLAEVILKLVVVYLLYITIYDKLVIYALLYAIIPILMNIVYKLYCNHNFKSTKYSFIWDKKIFYSLFSFSGWSLFGSLANMSAQQGINVLINIFFGVTANAAIGIANQVTTQVYQFISNFQIAFQPQIVKSYAANEIESLNKLIFRSAKMSYYMMFILTLPLILTTQDILEFWLVEVPDNTAIFCQLILGFLLIECISAPLWMTVQATGKIRKYQIIIGICIFINFPLTFIVYKIGMPVYVAWIIRIIVNIITLIARCKYMSNNLNFPVKLFVKNVIKPVCLVSLTGTLISYIISTFFQHCLRDTIMLIVLSIISSIIVIYRIGLEQSERDFISNVLSKKIFKK